jgi:excinuclease ABC subunit B
VIILLYNANMSFSLRADYTPTGDQPTAIKKLVEGFQTDHDHQVLLGVTGSGKTYTMANVIQETQLPTLVIAHNKTLAAQLYQEFRDFFPDNAVSYFVSYYDYYQPEAYIPTTDTYIEKEATINDEIDKLRLATTTNLLTRSDVIVIASVSCIYNLGSPVEYGRYLLELKEGEKISRETIMLQLANLQYERSDTEFRRGTYRVRGESIQVWPAYQDFALLIETLDNTITKLTWNDPVTMRPVVRKEAPEHVGRTIIYPAKHYVINPVTQEAALGEIGTDLEKQVAYLQSKGRVLEAYRLEQRVKYDMEMIKEFGFVNGIENYSRYFDGRQVGQPPFTLLEYFRENAKIFGTEWLTIIDESHITVPQIRGMYNGDQSRKQTLIEYGFRLPSASDNRPLQFHEFTGNLDKVLYVSATPQEWEVSDSNGHVAEQLIRPTGLIDPIVELRPTIGQIEDLILEIMHQKAKGQRTLVTTLTKKMAEALTEYLNDKTKVIKLLKSAQQHQGELVGANTTAFTNQDLDVENLEIGPVPSEWHTHATFDDSLMSLQLPKVAYLHSDIITLDRSDILDDLRRGVYDVLVGINLLREGLDLPEVTLVAILDADKEGFLRSATSLIQTIGRAARHNEGRALLYADKLTLSMKKAIGETHRRRQTQIAYNLTHQITPTTISKPIREKMIEREEKDQGGRRGTTSKKTDQFLEVKGYEPIDLTAFDSSLYTPAQKKQLLPKLTRAMKAAANEMDFEQAAVIRDCITLLQQ